MAEVEAKSRKKEQKTENRARDIRIETLQHSMTQGTATKADVERLANLRVERAQARHIELFR